MVRRSVEKGGEDSMALRELFKVTWLPVLVASLCCLSPVVLVLFGLSSVAFAASLSDVLYGQHRWAFRAAGLVLLALSMVLYFRRNRGICTLDEAKRRRNEVLNTAGLILVAGVFAYLLWLYVIVELVGIWLGIW
jgi:hypothetical protein